MRRLNLYASQIIAMWVNFLRARVLFFRARSSKTLASDSVGTVPQGGQESCHMLDERCRATHVARRRQRGGPAGLGDERRIYAAGRAALCGFDDEGRLTTLSAAPGHHALDERRDDMTFESGGQGLWSTLDDYLVFARMLFGDPEVPALLRGETLAMMTSNQLTPEQRAAARMFGRPIFAAGHGYGMGVAAVLEREKADPMRCRRGIGTIGWPGAYESRRPRMSATTPVGTSKTGRAGRRRS